jgi:predicted ATPase
LASLRLVGGNFELAAEGYERGEALLESTTKLPEPISWSLYSTIRLSDSGLNLWLLGYADRGLSRIKRAKAFALESGHRDALSYAHYAATALYLHLGDFKRLKESGEAALALATELGDSFRVAVSGFALGFLQCEDGDLELGLVAMREGMSVLRATGAMGGIPLFLTKLAMILGQVGQLDEALLTIDEAFGIIERAGDSFTEAEVHRLKGELLRAQDPSKAAQAENSFRTGIGIARRQKAKSWELRGTTSLARLLRDTNRRDEAHGMLAEIYGWFTEGFDTADLKNAKALLDELSN